MKAHMKQFMIPSDSSNHFSYVNWKKTNTQVFNNFFLIATLLFILIIV